MSADARASRGRMRGVRPDAQAHAARRRIQTAAAAAALVFVLGALLHQYAKTYRLAREEARLEQRRRELIADNARLHEEIERLQTDDRYIEQIAREQLGLVRPGEVELLVVPDGGPGAPPAPEVRRGATDGPAGPAAAGPDAAGPEADAAAPARPRSGFRGWADAVREAVLRLLRIPSR
jgi:cell division protein FtsB